MHVFVLSLVLLLAWLYAEVALLLYVAHRIGLVYAFALTVVTGVLGFTVARAQGWQLMARARRKLNEGELPVDTLLDGLILLVGGLLLITPGLITDAVGLLLMIPVCRRVVLRVVQRYWKRHAVTIHTSSLHPSVDIVHDDGVIDSVVVERHEEPQRHEDTQRIDGATESPE